MKVEKNKNLKSFNFYNLDLETKYFIELKSKKDFEEAFCWIQEKKIKKVFILAEGSNIIFKKEFFDGVILKVSNGFTKWEGVRSAAAHHTKVEVGAGKNLDTFLRDCHSRGIFDIQSLSSIPGSVGAGAFGNVGAFGKEIKNFISGIFAFDILKKEFVFIENKKCYFSYRDSFFKKNRIRFVVFSVVFDFSKKFQKEMGNFYKEEEYFSLEHFAKKHNIKNLKKEGLRKEIKKIRRKIYPNVKKFPNVGSTFGNTEVSKKECLELLKKYPQIPNWKQGNGKIKIPTAFIFDKTLDLNGKTFGNIKIDQERPLFFVNTGGAKGKEFFSLCQKIKKDIQKKLGIKIKEEIFFVE